MGAICAAAHGGPAFSYNCSVSAATDWGSPETWAQIAQVVAILLGGMFTYFKFFRGRTFSTRCQVLVSGIIACDTEAPCLALTFAITNSGQTGFWIQRSDSQFALVTAASPDLIKAALTQEKAVEWTKSSFVSGYRLFGEGAVGSDWWLEAGETVRQSLLVPVPSIECPYRIDTHIEIRRRGLLSLLKPRSWGSQDILTLKESNAVGPS